MILSFQKRTNELSNQITQFSFASLECGVVSSVIVTQYPPHKHTIKVAELISQNVHFLQKQFLDNSASSFRIPLEAVESVCFYAQNVVWFPLQLVFRLSEMLNH